MRKIFQYDFWADARWAAHRYSNYTHNYKVPLNSFYAIQGNAQDVVTSEITTDFIITYVRLEKALNAKFKGVGYMFDFCFLSPW